MHISHRRHFVFYGPTLAYTPRLGSVVSIVDWREVNGRRMKETFPVRCLRTGGSDSPSMVEPIHLLPGNRILLRSKSSGKALFTLHNWEKDCPSFNITGSHALIRTGPRPVWEFMAPHPTARFATQYPLIIRDSIRIVLPTRHVPYGLTIRMDDYSLDGVRVVPLIKAPFGDKVLSAQAFQLDRAVGIQGRDHEGMFYAQYSWPGEHSEGLDPSAFLSTSNPLRHRLPNVDEDLRGVSGSCLFDQFTNRVVVTSTDATRFFTIFSTRFTSEGEATSVDNLSTQGRSDSESTKELSGTASSEDTSPEYDSDGIEDSECVHSVSRGGSSNAASEGGSYHVLEGGYSDGELS